MSAGGCSEKADYERSELSGSIAEIATAENGSSPMKLDMILSDARRRTDEYRTLSLKAASASASARSGGTFYSQQHSNEFGRHRETEHHREQYRHFRGYVYTAIRPIATRIARQEFRAGTMPTSLSRQTAGPERTKMFRERMYCIQADPILRKTFQRAPDFIRKQLAEGMEVNHNHPMLRAFETPNDLMERWHLSYFTAASVQLTGKSYWYLDGPDENGEMSIWPFPAHWVTPVFGRRTTIERWDVTPTGQTKPIPIPADDMCYFYLPDPEDPTGALSPLQANAFSAVLGEHVQRSQLASYRNGPKPGVVIKAGRLPGPDGRPMDQRRILNPKQRRQLIDAVKYAYAGVEHHGEPAIIDGLIEDIYPWTNSPAEMDYINTDTHLGKRIDRGYGVSPISSGEMEASSYASSALADNTLCANVVNPQIVMMSQVMTRRFRTKFPSDGGDLYAWIEECEPHDAEMHFAKMQWAAQLGITSENDIREFLNMEPSTDERAKQPMRDVQAEQQAAQAEQAHGFNMERTELVIGAKEQQAKAAAKKPPVKKRVPKGKGGKAT
jgi:phage portal protein BeeE